MERSPLRRTGALLCSAALLASLTAATVAAPATAAKPTCQGRTATIVGTARSETIQGTARPDVIVAKGGNDRIYGKGGNDIICAGGGNDLVYGGPGADRLWGQLGNDRLFGNAGPDFLAGQVGRDPLNGGTGVDTCFQGTGTGPVIACERPGRPPAPPPAPPAGPSLVPMGGILAAAYSDIDGLDGYSTGDVLIARLEDTDGNGAPSVTDTIVLDRYPTDLVPSAFGDWGVKSHAVTELVNAGPGWVRVRSAAGTHEWIDDGYTEHYTETANGKYVPGMDTVILDGLVSPHLELLRVGSESPSAPLTPAPVVNPARYGDDRFVDVTLDFVSP